MKSNAQLDYERNINMSNSIYELVEKYVGNNYQNNKDFIPKPLKNDKGFMLFSNDEYYLGKTDKFSKIAQKHFKKYPQRHRFYFFEKLNGNKNNIIFLLYNPSYATPEVNDPTINNCIKLANDNNFSTIEVLNVYSERNPNIKNLEKTDNNLNIKFIKQLLEKRENPVIVLAWGHKHIPHELYDFITSYSKRENFKILTAQKAGSKIQIRHPGNQGWCKLGGFKFAQLTSIKDISKTLEDLIRIKE